MVRLVELIIRGIIKFLKFFGLWIPLCYLGFGIFLSARYKFAILSLDLWSTLYLAGLVASLVCAVIITLRNIFVRPFRDKIEQKKQLKQFKEIIREENLKEREFHLKRHQEIADKEAEIAEREKQILQKKKKIAAKERKRERRTAKRVEQDIDFTYLDSKTAPAYNANVSNYSAERKMAYQDREVRDAGFYEQPAIYKSAIDPMLLIHEFSDRFVVYREESGQIKLQKVEYK